MEHRQDIGDTNLRRRSGAMCAQERLTSRELSSQTQMLLAADTVDHQPEFPDDLYDGLGDDGELIPLFAAAQVLWERNRELLRP